MKAFFTFFFLASGIVSCAPKSVADDSSLSESASCAAIGGTVEVVGPIATPTCILHYGDADKKCSAKADCQGQCRLSAPMLPSDGTPAVGQCAATNVAAGCFALVEEGKTVGAGCV